VRITGDPDTSDPLRGYVVNAMPVPVWGVHRSIAEMQEAINEIIPQFWNHTRYPNGYDGMTYFLPGDRMYTDDDIATAIGYPDDPPTSLYQVLWRRRAPRRIYDLSTNKAAQSASYAPTWYISSSSVDAAEGDKAQYYQYGGGFISGPVPGTYRGVYVRQGGQWIPAPAPAVADTLDSSQPWASKDWIPPGYFEPGDYFGPHLLRDIRDACKLLKWGYADNVIDGGLHSCYPYSTTTSSLMEWEDKDLNYGSAFSTRAAAEADAAARVAAATPSDIAFGLIPMAMIGQTQHNTGDDTYRTYARTFSFQPALEETYQGRAANVDWFAYSQAFGTFDANGTGLVDSQFAKFGTKAMTAGANSYGTRTGDTFGSFATPPFGLDAFRGFQLEKLAAIVKWTFTDS
jgi:hypothetical protein